MKPLYIFAPKMHVDALLTNLLCLCFIQVQQTHQWHQRVQRTGPVSCVRSGYFYFSFMFSSSNLSSFFPPKHKSYFTEFRIYFTCQVAVFLPFFNHMSALIYCRLESLRESPTEASPLFTPHSVFLSSLLCLISALSSSRIPLHLHSPSCAVTVSAVLSSSQECPESVRMPFDCDECVFWCCALQRLDAQRETQVPPIGSEGVGHCVSGSTWTTRP